MIIDRGIFRRPGIEAYVRYASKPRTKPIVDGKVKKLLEKLGYTGGEEPQSIYEPDKLFEALQIFGERSPYSKQPEFDFAISQAYKMFGYRPHFPKFKPDPQRYLTSLKMEKSGGIYLSSKADSLADASQRIPFVLKGLKAPNPCIAFARTQRNKTRLVWGYPTDMAILESWFALQLIDQFKMMRSPVMYSLRRVEMGARLQATMKGRFIVGLDFSHFDSTVPASLIRAAFAILKTWFDLNATEERAWKTIVDYFINTPIVMPDGHLYTGKHKGIPSGSLFTQLVGSIVNFIVITAMNEKFKLFVPSSCIHVLGDDSIFSTNSNPDLNKMAAFLKNIGMVLNVEKSTITKQGEQFKFLGIGWKKGVPYFEDSRIWRSGVFPERYRLYPKDELMATAVAWKAVVLPLLSIGLNSAQRLALKSGRNGPICLNTEDPLLDPTKGRSGLLDYIIQYEKTRSHLWTPLVFPFSA